MTYKTIDQLNADIKSAYNDLSNYRKMCQLIKEKIAILESFRRYELEGDKMEIELLKLSKLNSKLTIPNLDNPKLVKVYIDNDISIDSAISKINANINRNNNIKLDKYKED